MSKIKLIFFPSLLADLPTFRMSSYFWQSKADARLFVGRNNKSHSSSFKKQMTRTCEKDLSTPCLIIGYSLLTPIDDDYCIPASGLTKSHPDIFSLAE
jgi:hypothetical protein